MNHEEVKALAEMIADLDERIWPIAEYIERVKNGTTTKEDTAFAGFLQREKVAQRLIILRRTINQIVFSEEKLAEQDAKLKEMMGGNPFVTKPHKGKKR